MTLLSRICPIHPAYRSLAIPIRMFESKSRNRNLFGPLSRVLAIKEFYKVLAIGILNITLAATDHGGQAKAPQIQAEAILRMRSGSGLPEAPHPFLPGGISGLNF